MMEISKKQLKSNRSFLDEQAVEREQEREEFQRELEKWKQIVQTKEKQTASENRLKREVDTLNEELQSRIDSHTEIVEQTQKLQRDLSDKQMTEEELKAVIRDLEQEVEEKNVREEELHKKITKLEQALEGDDKDAETEADRESPLPDGEEEDSDTGTTSSETTRAYRRRRKLPSHISLHQEEAVIKEKEDLLKEKDQLLVEKDQLLQEKEQLSQEKEEQQIQLEEQLKQISALRNQLDEMRHRGDFGDDSQASTLQRQLDRQKETAEEMERENGELREQMSDVQNRLEDKDKYIIQLTNQIQALGKQLPQKPDIDTMVQDLSQENQQLKAKLKSVEGELNSTPIPVLTQSLIEEKNQEIDHLNSQISHLNQEIEKLRSGETLAKLQEELHQLQSELDRRDGDNVRASQMSTYSMDTDTEGPPGVSESFAEKTNLQQELEDSVAKNWEEISDLKEEKLRLEKALQEKEEEILHLNEELHAKREVSPKSEDTGYVHDMLQEKELLIEQMTVQIEGLTAEVDGLTDFQTKLQEDFDTVQTMLEEKEREIETLTRELTEKPPVDPTTLDSVSVLESQVQKLKKDLKEKDNVIEEKEEEMYLLNEKTEEKDAELKTLQTQLAEKETEVAELKERAPSSEEVQVQLEERTTQLEEKSQELEKMREEFDTVKEHLSIAENLQRKLEQAGMLGPDILMKEKEREIQELKAEVASLKEKLQDQPELLEVHELESMVRSRDSEIRDLKDQLGSLQMKLQQGDPELIPQLEKELKEKEEDQRESQTTITDLKDQIDWLQQECETLRQLRLVQDESGQDKMMEKDKEIQTLQNEIISLKSKSAEENRRKLQEQLDRVNAIDEADDKWAMLQATQDRLEKTTHELTDTTQKLHQVEDRLGEINHQLEDKENDYKQLEADYWEAKAHISDSSNQIQDLTFELSKSANEVLDLRQQLMESTSENQDLKRKLDANAAQKKDSGLTLERSKIELDEIIQEKDQELNHVKERLKEAVELSEQQLHLVEQKDEEFVKLKIEIQQMIGEKDKIIKDLKKQLSDVEADKDMLQQELEEKMSEKVKVVSELEDKVEELKVKEEELERGGNAISMVTMLQEQLEERDKALREIHANLQSTQEELEVKNKELNQVRIKLEEQSQGEDVVTPETQREVEELREELRMAKEALENAKRLGGVNSRQHIPPLRLQDSTEIDEELELKDPEELREEILDLRKELDQRKSELQLYHSTASMSAKDYVQQKVMDLREELAHQHRQHIADLTERSRSEADTNLAQLRIRYEDEIDNVKSLHKKELEKKIGEVKRDLDKEHKTEINQLLSRHQEEIELMRIREPMLVPHETSALESGLQLRSEVRQTEQLDGQLRGSLSQLPEGLDNVDSNTVGSGDMAYDENLSARLRMLLNRLHNEGVQMLTLSELQFLNRHMTNQCVETEADIASLQAAWMNEKQSLLSAVQSLKDLLAQTHKYRSAEKYVFAKERETLLAELRSHVLSHPSANFTEIQKLEQKIRNQEAHQKEAIDQIFKADRQSMLAEIRDLRAHANINSLRYQEEKERLTDQLSNMEDNTTKRERQLKRQVQLLEYKLQQEKIIQDDLRTSLESEQHRTSELSSQISREKNNNLDLQSELSSQQIQISKLKDGLEREQSRFVSVTSALEEEKGKCQHLSDLLEKERSMVRTLRMELEDWKMSTDDRNKIEDVMEAVEFEFLKNPQQRMQAELNSERERVTDLEDSQQSDRSTISTLKHELEMEQKSLRTLDLEFKAKVKQMTTALELERAKSADLQSALERERNLNEKLRQNLDSERRALLESTDRENSIVEDMQMELESERSKIVELRAALDREKRRIACNLDNLETDRDKFREELDQERNSNRQLRNDLDQLELQKLDLTRHYEHERDQCIRLKNEREQLRSEVKGLKDRVSNQVRSRDTEKVSERLSHRQLERERDENRMKLHENELEIQRLTQKVLDLEEKATTSRERELEAKRDLEQEKLRNLQSQHINGDSTSPRSSSSDSQERWILYKTQLESICQSLQYLILQCQDQMSKARGIEGLADVISLEKPLKDLLSELKQIQMPLAFESEGDSNLLLRPNAHAINERVLHHNSELTNFVSRLTEEKMELRNTLSRLEEEIWRYRQHDGSMQNGDLETSQHSSDNKHLEDRANWAKERLSLQLALNRAESERDQYKADLRIERERRSTTPLLNGHGSEADKEKIQRLYGKYLRADSYRKALIYQKKYLLLLLGGFQDCEETTLALIARMGVYPSPEDMQRKTKYSKMKYLVRKWRRATRVGSPVMGGTVDPQQGYTPHSRSFSPPRVSSSRGRSPPRFTDSPKVTSSLSRPHLPSYSSMSHDQRGVTNGSPAYSSPYRGGASNAPYTPISPFTVGMNGTSNYSVHMTPPTRDYSSHKPSHETSGARRKILSSASTTPKATTPTSSHRKPQATEEQPSLHDDYIARLENLQIRLGSMENGACRGLAFICFTRQREAFVL
ncbi:hypothetical protein FSP39_011672 [Pinctada imbricata]|uniref:Pericentrin/AKAP-450 centrosomal targeting domain-containing protein n=1 Tax=Pinctada imbricata TaxID=66713 RepID=A0AA88YMB7_PINIB|nr:hypothetical protein FSP39_011672 [Pinctada imbricata]